MAKAIILVRILFLSVIVCFVSNAQRIPRRIPGFIIGSGNMGAGVQLESYIDLLCPDSKSAYLGLKKLSEYYEGDELCIRFVLFPLPYHQHAFNAAEATFTITTILRDESFTTWLETMYANQDRFWNKATKDLSSMQVVEKLKKLAQKTFPSLTDKQWDEYMTGYGGTDVDNLARESWKYACSRGISGTPLYTLNGVPFKADADWTFEQWREVIDPLVKFNQHTKKSQVDAQLWKNVHLSGSPRTLPDRTVLHLVRADGWNIAEQACKQNTGGEIACEFAPGRVMCCKTDEVCILREGCVLLQ